MTNIGDIVATLCTCTMYMSTNVKAIHETDKTNHEPSLDSKLVQFNDKIKNIPDTLNKKSNYFVLEKAKKVKDSFMSYFKNFLNFDYRKSTKKEKNKNSKIVSF